MMQRVFLLLQAMILLAFGLAYLLRPHEMANLSGMLLMQAAAISDVRAYYGALQMGLAAYLVLALTQHLARRVVGADVPALPVEVDCRSGAVALARGRAGDRVRAVRAAGRHLRGLLRHGDSDGG